MTTETLTLADPDGIRYFHVGEGWLGCPRCHTLWHWVDERLEHCPDCGPDPRPVNSVTITSIDRSAGTLTCK